MSAESAVPACANDACEVAVTGKCVEGTALEECPHLLSFEEDSDDVDDDTEDVLELSQGATPSLFVVSSGKPLCPARASDVLKSRSASVVALVGQAEAGKTSLIAEIYDAFQYGNYSNFFFGGSSTLLAFEKIFHKVRGTSRADNLHEERTDVDADPVFYHLTIANAESERRDILIADRSGEIYREILDRPSLAGSCLELRCATVLNLLVDGARLTLPMERSGVITECHNLMQAFIYGSLIESNRRINVILTKLDHVDSSSARERAHADFDQIVNRMRRISSDISLDVDVFRIAARPNNDLYSKGYGVEALIGDWFERVGSTVQYQPGEYSAVRAIDTVKSSVDMS